MSTFGGFRFFFFSSRRRHTRWTGDWSSDVCSSDLGYEWLAEWQYARYVSAALEVLRRGAEHEARAPRIDLADLAAFLVAAADGLVIRYEVTHDEQACQRELEQVIRAGALLAGVTPPA